MLTQSSINKNFHPCKCQKYFEIMEEKTNFAVKDRKIKVSRALLWDCAFVSLLKYTYSRQECQSIPKMVIPHAQQCASIRSTKTFIAIHLTRASYLTLTIFIKASKHFWNLNYTFFRMILEMKPHFWIHIMMKRVRKWIVRQFGGRFRVWQWKLRSTRWWKYMVKCITINCILIYVY